MAVATISSGMAFVLLALAVPVADRVPPAAPAILDQRFDLAAVTRVQPQFDPDTSYDARIPQPYFNAAELVGDAWTPPRKTWGSAERGPIIQIGALGTKDKRIPDLAHLSFDWDF